MTDDGANHTTSITDNVRPATPASPPKVQPAAAIVVAAASIDNASALTLTNDG